MLILDEVVSMLGSIKLDLFSTDKDSMEKFALWQRLQTALKLYRHEPSDLDRSLIVTIDRVVENYQDIQARNDAIEVLGHIATNLPSLVKLIESRLSNEVDRQEIIDKTRIWTVDNIHKFKPTGKSISTSLGHYLYKWVYWRIHDLINNVDRPKIVELDLISLSTVGRDGIDELIDRIQTEERERQRLKFPMVDKIVTTIVEGIATVDRQMRQGRLIDLVETDRSAEISSIYYKIPACNYQYLFRQLIIPQLNGIKPNLKEIVTELGSIEYHALTRHLNDIFYPWLDGLYLEILDYEEWQILKDSIDMQSQKLSETYRKGTPDCNIYFLAQQLLPCYQKPPLTWDELAQKFQTGNWHKATPEYIEKFWNNESRPILGKIARQIVEYQ